MYEEREDGFDPENDKPRDTRPRNEILEKLGINEAFDKLPLEARARVLAMQYLAAPKSNTGKPVVKLPFLDLSGNNQVYKSHRNTQMALSLLGVGARYEQFGVTYELTGVEGCYEMDETAIRAIQQACEIVNYRLSEATIAAHVSRIAEKHTYHLMRDKFGALEWDGVQRLDTWLPRYLLTPDNDLTRFWSAAQLIMAVHRIMRASIDNPVAWKHAPILEGPQDGGKSSALRVLAFDRYFTDTLEIGADSKTAIEQTSGGVLFVEFAEMALNRMAKAEHNKAFMSRAVDKARLAYGRSTKVVPRQWVGWGTTNERKYMTDATGNVRYIGIQCGVSRANPVDLDGLRGERDQIWAEAVAREAELNSHNDFGVFLPSLALRDQAAEEAQDRLITSHLMDDVADLFDSISDKIGEYAFVANSDLQRALGLDAEAWRNGRVTSEVKRGMMAIGWTPAKVRHDAGQQRGYERGERPHPVLREHRMICAGEHLVPLRYIIDGTAEEV